MLRAMETMANVTVSLFINETQRLSNRRVAVQVRQVAGVDLRLFRRVFVRVLSAQVIFVVLLDLRGLRGGPKVSVAFFRDGVQAAFGCLLLHQLPDAAVAVRASEAAAGLQHSLSSVILALL